MDFIVNSIVSFIVGLFPALLSTLYGIYEKSLGKMERYLYVDISLVVAEYLLVFSQSKEMVLVVSIPLLLSILEKRDLPVLLCSVILCTSFLEEFNFLLLEYVILFVFYYMYKKNNVSIKWASFIFLCIKLLFFWLYYMNIFSVIKCIYISLIFIVFIILLVICYNMCKMTVNLFVSVRDLEEHKQIKGALFKISHEIKNPLAVCKGYLDMYDYTNVEHTKRFVPIVKSEIEKSLVILHDFLNLSKTNLNLDIIDINLLIEDCLGNIELLLKSNHICVVKELVDDDLYVNGDYTRLHQVFVNVIKNSVEAMENCTEKKIFIRTSIVNNSILIVFEDTGTGIDKDVFQKIMDPFFTTKANGTGLGIPLSIEIINAHDGKMEYSNVSGGGTKVEIILPFDF